MHQVVSTRHPSISLRGIALGLLTLCALPATAHAAGRVVLELRPATRTSADGWITVVARNVGDESVPIMTADTPFARKDGLLPGAALEVLDGEGVEVGYRGGWEYFGRLTMDHFAELRPGETWKIDIDVGHEYRVRAGGTYHVRYRLRLDHEPDVDVVPAALRETFRRPAQALAESNELTLHIVGDPTARLKKDADDGPCDPHQSLTILNARAAAQKKLIEAEDFVWDRYKSVAGSDGDYHIEFSPHPRYTRWFGAHDDNGPEFGSAGWGLDDNATVYETLVASRKRIANDLDMRCGCPGSGENASASALTETRYTIRFCPKFFTLPEADAYASRVGTLVHEYTHFNALYPGTGDYVYGWQKAEELAKKDRSNAVRNADNFEYFVMDTRPYDP